MSHPFSSTFDALQAHFAKKATATGTSSNTASQNKGSTENSASNKTSAASPHPISIAHSRVQHTPSQNTGSLPNNLLSRNPVHSATPYSTATSPSMTIPIASDSGTDNMIIDPPNHLQPPGSQSHDTRPLLLGHDIHAVDQTIRNTNGNSGSMPSGLPPSHGHPGQSFRDSDFAVDARYIAQIVNDFMNESDVTLQAQNPQVGGGNLPNPNSNPSLGPEAPNAPADTVVDSLLDRQNELRSLEAAQKNRTHLGKRNMNALDDALQQNPVDFEGSSQTAKKGGFPPNKYFEDGGRGSSQPSTRARGRAVRRRGPRKAAEPTGDVKLRLNMASEAYLQGRIDDAIQLVEDAIRINAEIHRAWILLAQLFEERGELRKRLTAQICGAQLEPKNIDRWLSVAQQAVALRDMYPDDADELTRQAIFCYSSALRADIELRTARHGRAALTLERGRFKGAAKDYNFLVSRLFYDIYALRGLAETSVLLAENSKRKQAAYTPEDSIAAYRRCIAHFRDNGIDPEYPFDWEDVYIFVDLLGYLKRFKEAIHELKSLARWILDRSDESFWDHIDDSTDDDREWDTDNTRRLEISGFQEGQHPDTSYGNGLPLQLRTKLGIYRLELDQEDEAMRHLEWLDPSGDRVPELLSEYTHLILEAGSALYEKGKYELALRFYEPLWDVPDALDANALLRAGRCHLSLGDKRQAEECFTAAIDADELNYQPCIDARLELARMYEVAKEDREAYILVSEAIKLQEAQEEEEALDGDMDTNADEVDEDMDEDELDPPNLSLDRELRGDQQRKKKLARRVVRMRAGESKPKTPRPPRPLRPKVQRQRPRVFGLSEEVRKEEERRSAELATQWQIARASREELEPTGHGPPETFMMAAGALIDDFRSYKDFYSWENYLTHLGINQASQKPVTRNPNLVEMAERLSHNLSPGESGPARPTSEKYAVGYRGVPFSEWLDLFLEYAMGLAHYGKFLEAYKVCESARDAVVFANSKDDMFLVHVTWAACALHGRDEEACIAMARYFTSKHQFDTDAFRMFAALSRLCASPASWYASGPVQKFLLRQIRIMDTTLMPKQSGREESPGEDGIAEQTTYPGKELDSTLLTLYGHVLFISNSFTYALNYFLRALSIDPTNKMIVLSIGQCYIQDGLKRQSDNRQYLLAQGFAFLHCYYDARLAELSSSSASAAAMRQEAHYNLARTYHGVGIPHLAAEYYRRALLEDVAGLEERERDVEEENGGGSGRSSGIMGPQDISREAAFNLQQLCLAGGDMESVRAIGERFMAI